MKWIPPNRGNGFGRIVRRLAILALPAALVVGCGDSDDNPPPTAVATATATLPAPTQTAVPPTHTVAPPTQTQTPAATATSTATPMGEEARTACAKLVGCDQCFINQTGHCIPNDACAGRLSSDVAICINGVSGCDPTTLGDCLFLGCQGDDATGECG